MWIRVWRALRGAWWVVVALGAGAVGLVAVVVLWRPGSRAEAITWRPGDARKQPLKDRARAEVERVRLEGELEKAHVKAEHQSQRVVLSQIEKTGREDPAEARRRLARWLEENL